MIVFFCAESYILAKSTKLSQLELLFWFKYAPNRLSAGASPQTPLGSLERSPDTVDTIVALRGLLLRVTRKVEKGKGKVGEGRDRREKREGKGGKGWEKREGREMEFGPPTLKMLPPPVVGIYMYITLDYIAL